MTNGWTGGQYSLFRAGLGAYLFVHFVRRAVCWDSTAAALMLFSAAVLSVWLIIGRSDRAVALLLACVCVVPFARAPLIAAMLGLHALLPPAPYGSWSSRGRVDPGGAWSMPAPLYAAAWALLAVSCVTSGHSVIGLAVAALALNASLRPWVWGFMLVRGLLRFADSGFDAVLLQGLTFDPSWIPVLAAVGVETIFYDGHCGLCHSAVRFVLAEERDGGAFRFAPLQSETFLDGVPENARATLPDSIVVRTAGGVLLARSDATAHILARLGGIWRLLAALLWLIPVAVRDGAYDSIARVRHRLFRAPAELCPIMPAHLRPRFDF